MLQVKAFRLITIAGISLILSGVARADILLQPGAPGISASTQAVLGRTGCVTVADDTAYTIRGVGTWAQTALPPGARRMTRTPVAGGGTASAIVCPAGKYIAQSQSNWAGAQYTNNGSGGFPRAASITCCDP